MNLSTNALLHHPPGTRTEKVVTLAEDVFYWTWKGKYLLPDRRGDWIPPTRQDAADYLIDRYGLDKCGAANGGLSPIDRELLRIRRAQAVDYANSLAGYKRGHYPDLNGKSILVTSEPKAIVPVRGDWRVIKQIINALLTDPSHDQITHFHGWVAEIVRSRQNQKWRPGQILALVGRASNGKSLLESIITLITGGREADPTLFLSRRTNFNGELFAAEHLRINDEIVACGAYAIRQLQNGLKQIAANRKNNRGIDLPVFWRCSVLLNDGPDDIALVPDMDDAMADKFILLKSSPAKRPMPTDTVEQEAALWAAIEKAMACYIYWLLHDFVLLAHLRSSRYGVKHFHHRDIIGLLRGRLPEDRLLRLIDHAGGALFVDGKKPWTGTAAELKSLLLHSPAFVEQEARVFLAKAPDLGQCLELASAKFPERVKAAHNTRKRPRWVIFPVWQAVI